MKTLRNNLVVATVGVVFLLLSAMMAADAQQSGLAGLGNPNEPLEIEADNGLELYQDRNLVVAKGNVVAKQGEVTLRSDLLSAAYDGGEGDADANKDQGPRRIRRLDAVGNVRIETARERLFGDHATYDLVRELMIITGDGLRIEGSDQIITADDSLEFWGKEQRAVARGNAEAAQGTTRLRADVIEAELQQRDQADKASAPASSQSGSGPLGVGQASAVKRIRAWGRVVIRTPTEIVEGDRGDYDVANQVATLTGNVRISRGRNQLNGEKAVVDMKSGVSRLSGGSTGRVRSILFPGGGNSLNAPAPQTPRRVTASNAPVPPRPPAERPYEGLLPKPRPVGAP